MLDTSTVLATGQTSVGNDLSVNRKLTPYAGVVYDLNPQWSVYGSVTNISQPADLLQRCWRQRTVTADGLSKEIGVKGELLTAKPQRESGAVPYQAKECGAVPGAERNQW